MVYECIVCLEGLNSQAPPIKIACPEPQPGTSGANEAGTSSGRATKKSPRKAEDLKENCATYCGHIFHRACLNRWFTQNGKKNCPSCRKPLTLSKIIRIFPPGMATEIEEEPAAPTPRFTEIEESSIPKTSCINQQCTELYEVHRTLVGDHNELVEKYGDKCDEVDILTAQNASLEDECLRLKKSLQESQAAVYTKPKKTMVGLMRAKSIFNTGRSSPRTSTAASLSSESSDDSSSEDDYDPGQKRKKSQAVPKKALRNKK